MAFIPVAKSWNVIADFSCRFQNREVGIDFVEAAFDFDFDFIHGRLLLGDGAEAAKGEARSAADATGLIDRVRFFAWGAVDTGDRAVSRAERAFLATVFINREMGELFANVNRALLVLDVGFVFFREVLHRRKNRVGRGFAKGA